MNRKLIFLVTLGTILASTLTLAASGGVSKSTTLGPAQAQGISERFQGKEPIVFGMPVALSGFINFFDSHSVTSAKIAVQELNAQGGLLGRPVKLVTADTKSNLSLIRAAALQVINKGAMFLIPTLDYDFGSPSARVGQQHKPPILSITESGDPRFGVKGIGPHAFNLYSGPTEGAAAATFACKIRKWKRAYFLNDFTLSYSKEFVGSFTYTWKKLCGDVAGEDAFQQSDPSIPSQITRLRSDTRSGDFIVLGSYPPGGASAIKQIRAAGINLPIIAGAAFDGTFWLTAVPDASNVFVTSTAVTTISENPNPLVRDVLRKYRKFTGKDPQLGVQTLNGYSAIQAYAIAIRRAKSTDTEKVRAELNKFRSVPLPVGRITWTPKCHITFKRTMLIITFAGGKEKLASPVQASVVRPSIC